MIDTSNSLDEVIFLLYFRTVIVNQLKSLTIISLAGQLPSSLSVIEVRGDRDWIPDDSLLQIQNLQVIRGVSMSDDCRNCTLQRNYTYKEQTPKQIHSSDFSFSSRELSKGEFFYGVHSHCRGHLYKVIGNMTGLIARYGFLPRCIAERKECLNSEMLSTPIHRCYETDNDLLNIALVIGPIAMVLNLLTVVTILSTKSLRRTTSMLIVSNMAISDILNSFYTVFLVSARKVPYLQFLAFMGSLCKFFGFIWFSGQFAMITTSLLLTIERYLVIVFVMNPDRKLRKSHALSFIAVSWAVAIIVSSLPFLGIGTYVGNTFCVPIRPIKDPYYSYELTILISFVGISLYLIIIALYVHIFVFVKKSSQLQVNGSKRENAMAKRIALLVFSNMIFYFTPILIGLLWVMTTIARTMTPITKEILTGALPLLLFSFNSLLNPLLYAFRNGAFRQALKGRLLQLGHGKVVPLVSTANRSESRGARPNVDTSVSYCNKKQVRFELHDLKSK